MLYKTCVYSIVLCVVIGALRAVDLLLFSEEITNFVTFQSVWLRYAVLAAAIAAFYVVFKRLVLKSTKATTTGAIKNSAKSAATDAIKNSTAESTSESIIKELRPNYVMLAVLSVLLFVAGVMSLFNAFSEFIAPTTNFGHFQSPLSMLIFAYATRLVFAIGLIIFGVFCAVICTGKKVLKFEKTFTRAIGLTGAVAFCLLCTLRYAQHPASVHRITYILSVCSAIAALVFVTKLLGVMYKEPAPKVKWGLISSGLSCFLMCTCIEFVQAVLLLPQGIDAYTLVLSATLAMLGIFGAQTALSISK